MSIFSEIDFEGLQRVLYPVLDMLTGVDIADIAAGKSVAFKAAADGFSEVAGLFDMIGMALEDGILSGEEIDAIVADAADLGDAYDAIRIALLGADDSV